jgi:hypothetical protein
VGLWTTSLLETVEEYLRTHERWKHPLVAGPARRTSRAVHLAIFVPPFLEFLLDGRKTIESRFSVNRCPPFERVDAGDLVLVKQSGGPVVAVAEVSRVWYYHLDATARDFIRVHFSSQLCIEDPDFWDAKASSCYATLMQFSSVERLDPIPCLKRDRRGWVVLDPARDQDSLFAKIQNI